MFYGFLKSSKNLQKSSEVFGYLRKFSENFGNGSKVVFRCFYDFLILFRLGFLTVAQLGGRSEVPAAYNSKTINDNETKLGGVVKDH